MVSDNSYIIIGAGGHARVIIDIIHKSGFRVKGILDDSEDKQGGKILGETVIGKVKNAERYKEDCFFIIAVGDNKIRFQISKNLESRGFFFGSAIHPGSVIGENVEIGYGTVVMAGTVINSGTIIGKHCIINTSSSIDHDNVIDDYVHISPGSVTGGGVCVGGFTWLGLGSRIINNINIGRNSIIAAGSTVIKDIPDSVMAAGVPAEIKKEIRGG